jgi:hypothetical protein
MTAWSPDWKLTVAGVDYTDIAISDVQHQAGRTDIYQQPNPSYVQITFVALSGQTLPFDLNDSLSLQVKDTSGAYVNIFGGDITDITVAVGATGTPVSAGLASGAFKLSAEATVEFSASTAVPTNAVVAICAVLVPTLAFGASGAPVKVGFNSRA